MSIAITNPTNSFVRFNEIEPTPQCGREIGICLPVYAQTDVRFQMIINVGKNESLNLYARIVSQCSEPVPNNYNGFYSGTFTKYLLSSSNHYGDTYLVVLNLLGETELEAIECGECFYIQLVRRTTQIIGENDIDIYSAVGCSNCFYRICDPCFTSVISYRCDEDAFGFDYYHVSGGGNVLAGFYNKIRLPFYLKEPQFPKKKNVFIKSDGARKTLSSRIEKEYNAFTDYMTEQWHERLVIALEHDTVLIESPDAPVSPALQFTCESNYDIEWQRFLNYPTAPAKFKVKLTPYNNYNSNCN